MGDVKRLHERSMEVLVTVKNPEMPGHDKGYRFVCNLHGMNLPEAQKLVGRLMRGAVKSAALHDKYGWQHQQLEDSPEFQASIGDESKFWGYWEDIEKHFDLTLPSR